MPEVRLAVDGTEWGGWQSYRINLGMQQLAGSFELRLTERWAGQDSRRALRFGAPCTLHYDGELLITGYLDNVAPTYNGQDHSLMVAGRDKTADLVDCSAPATQWIGRSLAAVARELCAPFGIAVIDLAGANAPFRSLKPNDGETVFEMLDQAARIRGVLLITDGRGNLVITRAGTERANDALRLGDNILSASGNFDLRDVFSSYSLKGQQPGDDWLSGETAAAVLAKASDSRIKRHRPLTLIADAPLDAAGARDRVIWERNVRWGRSQSVTYSVQGHRQRNGALWRPNMLAPVFDAYQFLDGEERLITDLTYILDEQGERSDLTVMPREAFDLVEQPEPEATDASW
ncbi:phage baseplate assembly protein [Pseudomonas sp. MBLB4136]|uniref:phage baseplate assembly protein n=1 Tax=Pseudomonas sp. MBLB4136 TaxID=3451558 RepID=UPI003F74BA8D